MTARTLRKNLKNQQRPVIDRHIERPLEVALLGRTERLVKQNFGGTVFTRRHLDFFGFAGTHKKCSIGRFSFACHAGNGHHPSRLGQQS